MLIIDQWGQNGTESIKTIDLKKEDSKYCLFINGQKYGESESEDQIKYVQEKLYFFVNNYKRFTDTFDIGAELKKE